MAIKNSIRLFKESKKVLVAGVNSPVRSFLSVGCNPLVIASGKGSKIFDEDGNSYTDYCLSWGALILGHRHPDVMKAATAGLSRGTSFGTTTKPEIEIAQFITKHVPSVELVRFVNSGTEATMSAIRLARGFTKKNKVIKFDGGYHGHCDDLLIQAGSGVSNLKKSSSLGIPKNHLENTFSLPLNNKKILEEIISQEHQDIACCIIEPVCGNMGVVIAQAEFLQAVRNLTKKFNIVLIFDEVMTGFRTSLGCAQSDFGIIPDLTCLGKIIGGGFPVGAYGGRKDIMEGLAPLGGVYQAGTFSGNPVVMRAGLATLKNLSKTFYAKLNRLSDDFASRINLYFEENGISAQLSHYKSMLSLRFKGGPIYNYADCIAASSKSQYSGLFQKLLEGKIYWPPADLEAFFISGQHKKNDLDRLADVIKKVLS